MLLRSLRAVNVLIGDLARAAELSYGTLMNLQKELEAEKQKLAEIQAEGAMLNEEVDAEDVAEVSKASETYFSTPRGNTISQIPQGILSAGC